MDPISNAAQHAIVMPPTKMLAEADRPRTDRPFPTATDRGDTQRSPYALTATVVRGLMEADSQSIAENSQVEDPERTLKPYGIGMLPDVPVDVDQTAEDAPESAGDDAETQVATDPGDTATKAKRPEQSDDANLSPHLSPAFTLPYKQPVKA